MGNSILELVYNFTGEAQQVVITWRKTSAPLVEIGRIAYTTPNQQHSLLIENLDPVMYFITAYRSSDGIALDQQINVLAANARSGSVYPINTYEYIVDRGNSELGIWADPIDRATGITDTRLLGKQYWVSIRGIGQLGSDEIVDTLGGWNFTDVDRFLENKQRIFVNVIDRVDSSVVASSGGISGVFELNANAAFDTVTMAYKLIIAKTNNPVLTLTMPNLLLLPDMEFAINTGEGNQNNTVIQLDVGDNAFFAGVQRNKIIIGKSDYIHFRIYQNKVFVQYDGSAKRRGERTFCEQLGINMKALDGSEFNGANFPGLVQYIEYLPVAAKVPYSTWNQTISYNGYTLSPYKVKWGFNGTGLYRFPDTRDLLIRGMHESTNPDGVTQGINSYTHFGVQPHTHLFQYKNGKSDQSEAGTQADFMRKLTAGGDNYGNGNQFIDVFGSGETRGKSVNMIAAVYI